MNDRPSSPLSVTILVAVGVGGVVPLGIFLAYVLPEDALPPVVFYMILWPLLWGGELPMS